MKPENEQFLKDNIHHWESVRDTQTLRMLDGPTRQRMVDIMREEWHPGYATDLWCAPCVFDMVTAVYTRFDQYIASKPLPELSELPESSEVKSDESLIVHANFPKNDPPDTIPSIPADAQVSILDLETGEEKLFPHNLDDIKPDGVTPAPELPKQKNKRK